MEAIICRKQWLGESLVLFELEEPHIASLARPGQFVMVKVERGWDPFLRRPLGIMQAQGDRFTLCFEVVGRGTQFLAHKEVGERLDVLGPLGNGFSLTPFFGVLVAGGRGFVPLFFLASTFVKEGVPFVFFWGVRNRKELPLFHLGREFPSVFYSCEEGMEGGFCGDVLTLCRDRFTHLPLSPQARGYACGPAGMLAELAKEPCFRVLPFEVSLEALMGCGFGVCLSCAVKAKRTPGYLHVCHDGPVFSLDEVEL